MILGWQYTLFALAREAVSEALAFAKFLTL
jgi:hypothetical protein